MPAFAELASAALAAKEPYGPTASAALSTKGNAGEYASAQLAANGGYAASADLAAKTPSYAEYDSANLSTGGGSGPAVPGASATVFGVAPTSHYHPNSQSATLSSGRVTACPDIRGLAALTEGAAGAGPFQYTDAPGRKFWRLNGAEYLNGATALVADQRGITVLAVVRQHRASSGNFFGLGNAAAGTAVNTQAPVINTSISGGVPPYLRGTTTAASSDATNKQKLIVGSQLQVIAVASRPTASGGQRLYINNDAGNVVQSAGTLTGIAGFEIGRNPFSPGASGTWLLADIYEMAVFVGVLTNAQVDARVAEMVANWNIPQITNQAVLEGDSITQGTGTVTVGNQMSMQLSEPGAAWALPSSWRVINLGVSGNTVANLVTRRDAANTMFDNLLPGRNVVAPQIGRNDVPSKTGAQVYAEIVPLLNTASTGYLQRGWEVRQAVNIGSSAGLMTAITDLRTLLRISSFQTDTLTGPGQTYDGKLKLIELPMVTSGASGSLFDTAADAGDTNWFQGDSTHPGPTGALAMANGADTPAYGYSASILAA